MANKYIRHGETYCGDGTTSAAAASDGAAGAWNNINVFEGSAPAYGALAVGDTVYIRSKDAGGANITKANLSISLGSATATLTAPITWVLDAGTVWPGITGVLTYSVAGQTITFRANNNIIADARDGITIVLTSDWPGAATAVFGGFAKNIKVDFSIVLAGNAGGLTTTGANGTVVLENPTIKVGYAQSRRGILCYQGDSLVLINPDIELTNASAGQYVFEVDSYYGSNSIECRYGRIRGVGATEQSYVLKCEKQGNAMTRVKFIGTAIPTAMPISSPSYPVAVAGAFEMFGLDGVAGSYLEEQWGWATSRTDNNPPVLLAQLPDSALSAWAWRVYPRSANFKFPVKIASAKIYTGDPAAKTITLEFLTANTLSINKRNTWMTVEYIDNATSLGQCASTFDPSGSASDTSSAAWNVTTWGLVTCTKSKMTLTTPTSIKKDTLVTVTFWSNVGASSANDIFFLDADFSVT